MKRLFRHACAMLAVLLVMSMFTVVNAYVPYLIATTDVQFTSGDDVCKKAAELCKDAKTDMDKVTAIYNCIAGHYTYDTKLANDITSGKVSKYIPDTGTATRASATTSRPSSPPCAAARTSPAPSPRAAPAAATTPGTRSTSAATGTRST